VVWFSAVAALRRQVLVRSTRSAGITPVAYSTVPFSVVSTGWFFLTIGKCNDITDGSVLSIPEDIQLRGCGVMLSDLRRVLLNG